MLYLTTGYHSFFDDDNNEQRKSLTLKEALKRFDEEYEEDSVDKDKEIESLKHKLEIANNKLNMIKRNVQILTPDKLLEIIENYTGFFGKGSDKE